MGTISGSRKKKKKKRVVSNGGSCLIWMRGEGGVRRGSFSIFNTRWRVSLGTKRNEIGRKYKRVRQDFHQYGERVRKRKKEKNKKK
jgi:hypothetical protein